MNDTVPQASLPEYYAALTGLAIKHPANLLAIHYGLWGPDTTTDKEALLRANQTLVRGYQPTPGQRVLDAGCGVGGTVIWLAQEYDIQVVGLTNCESHVALATEQARQRGVGDRALFHYGDFMQMPFEENYFDAVLNHETYCYAADKPAYLKEVYRVLKAGGRWQAVDGFLTDKKLSERDHTIHADMQRGWHTEPLQPWRDVIATCEATGFENISDQDLDMEVIPAAERLEKMWVLFGDMFNLPGGLDKTWAHKDFRQGVRSYLEGLKSGLFNYRLISAIKPGSGQPAHESEHGGSPDAE